MGIMVGLPSPSGSEKDLQLNFGKNMTVQVEMRAPHLPAEWHLQSGIQLTWPHAGTDWAYMLKEVQECFVNIAREIAKRELLLIVTPEPEEVKKQIVATVNMDNVRFLRCETNDTWARDHGAITMIDTGNPSLLDFTFNGWGLKFASELDNLITYMGNKKNIDLSDIQTVISDTSASSQEDLCYFVAQGFTEKAVASYNRLVFEGEQPVSLIRTLSYHFMKLLDCAVKMEKGETADKVVFGMRPPLMFFRKNAFLSQLRIWNRMRIMNALALLYQTERECKTTDFPAEQAASFTIMRIANGVKRFR